MLLWAEVLVAQYDHKAFGERALDLVHLQVLARFGGDWPMSTPAISAPMIGVSCSTPMVS